MTSTNSWWRRSSVLIGLDVVLAIALTVVGQVELRTDPTDGYTAGPIWVNVILSILTTVPVAVRRLAPVPAWLVPIAAILAADLLVPHSTYFWSTGVPLALLTYTVARTYVGVAATWVWLPPFLALALGGLRVPASSDVAGDLTELLLFISVTAAGRTVRVNAQRGEQLRDALEELAADQQRQEQAAVLAERATIRREFDDVLAHVMGEMILQVGAARLELESQGVTVPEQLVAAEATGRRALRDVAVSLDVGAGRQPLPTLADLPALVAEFRSAGLSVSVQQRAPASLPTTLQVTVYRVIQESLANVLKHAGPVPTTVDVGTEGTELVVAVTDSDRDCRPPRFPAGGHGLPGMRERAAVFGGSVVAGPTRDGFAVEARFPLASVEVIA